MEKQIVAAYTDGSNDLDKLASWAFIIVQKDKILHQDSGVLTGDVCKIRNIGGELSAVMHAIKWCKINNYKVQVTHDLEGIERWGTGKWKRNNQWTIAYFDFCVKHKDVIAGFTWTKAHLGGITNNSRFNEIVDGLAGEAISKFYSKLAV